MVAVRTRNACDRLICGSNRLRGWLSDRKHLTELMQINLVLAERVTFKRKDARMKPVKTWILIDDANRARILENDGPGKGLIQLGDKFFKSHAGNLFEEQPGRTFHSLSPTRHKMENKDSNDIALINHVDAMWKSLEDAVSRRECDRLVICAPPNTLGVIRDRMPEKLHTVILAEVPKDLTHIPTSKLHAHFENVLAL